MSQRESPDPKKGSKKYADIAENVFAPIYPVIARQIIDHTKIIGGTALDIGTGPGHLATALAMNSDLTIHALDISTEMIDICEERIRNNGLQDRIIPVTGDVSSIPFPDATFDLIISRGSWFFWEDLPKSLSEIYRVLRPGGMTYIGGGFGSARLKEEIMARMTQRDPDFSSTVKSRLNTRSPEIIHPIMNSLGISTYSIINDESGLWLNMVHS